MQSPNNTQKVWLCYFICDSLIRKLQIPNYCEIVIDPNSNCPSYIDCDMLPFEPNWATMQPRLRVQLCLVQDVVATYDPQQKIDKQRLACRHVKYLCVGFQQQSFPT